MVDIHRKSRAMKKLGSRSSKTRHEVCDKAEYQDLNECLWNICHDLSNGERTRPKRTKLYAFAR
jgi:hypothetical protein